MKPNILIYARNPAPWRDWLAEHGCRGSINIAANREEATDKIVEAEVLLSWRFPPDLFSLARRLRWVQSIGAGVEDLVGTTGPAPDVTITRVVGQFGGPIAEYVFAELLARVRQVARLRELQARREWDHIEVGTLAGTRLGVAGLGSIGAEIVRKGRAFDMPVNGLSRSGAHTALVDRHFGSEEWPDFVHDLDVLVLTLPLTPHTERVVNAGVLAAMRNDALLVNVGRGKLVDEPALIAALQAGQIGGAILDVFEREPLPPESTLWALPNVTVTPHLSGPSTVEGVGTLFLDNLDRCLKGEPLLGVVDRAAGY